MTTRKTPVGKQPVVVPGQSAPQVGATAGRSTPFDRRAIPRSPGRTVLMRLRDRNALSHLGGGSISTLTNALSGQTDLTVVIAALLEAQVSAEALAWAVSDIPGGPEAFNQAAQSYTAADEVNWTGRTTPGVQIGVESPSGQIVWLGAGNMTTDTPSGVGIAYAGITVEEARRLGLDVSAGDEVNVVWGQIDETGQATQSDTMRARLVFEGTPEPELAEITRSTGIVPGAAGQTDEDIFAQIAAVVPTAGQRNFLGMTGREGPVRRRVPTWVAPSGYVEVPPTFENGDEQGPASWPYQEVMALQQRWIDKGVVPPGAVADGMWSSQWADTLAYLMGRANLTGAVLPTATQQALGRSGDEVVRRAAQPVGRGTSYTDRARWDAIEEMADEYVTFRAANRVKVPEFRPPIVRLPDPAQHIEELQNTISNRYGRRLDDVQLRRIGDWLTQQYLLEAQVDDRVAAQQHYEQYAQDPSYELTPEQREIANTRVVYEVNPELRLRQKLDEMFAADRAQMADRARFRQAQQRQGALQGTIMSAVAGLGG